MTAETYKQLRLRLELSNAALAPALGVSLRTAQRYESGAQPVAETAALLLQMYIRHGLPKQWGQPRAAA